MEEIYRATHRVAPGKARLRRTLSPDHFEFRGGERPIGTRAVLGRRPGD